jgi:hypothetical protein
MSTMFSAGALVRRKRHDPLDRRERNSYGPDGDPIWAIRCQSAREDWWHLVALVERDGQLVRESSVVCADDFELVRPAPTFRPAQKVLYEGREARVLEDFGDEVEIVANLSKATVGKAELVLAQL